MERRVLLPSDIGLSLRPTHMTGGPDMTAEDGIAKLHEVAAWRILLASVSLHR
jgi:hypothetical protein